MKGKRIVRILVTVSDSFLRFPDAQMQQPVRGFCILRHFGGLNLRRADRPDEP